MLTTVLLIAAVIADLCIYMNGSRIHFGSEEDAAVVQGDGYSIKATIDGKYISKEVLDRFVIKRIRKAEKKLDLAPMKVSDADTMLAALTDEKMKMGPDAIARKLDKQIRFCDKATVAIIRLSGGKTKFCITEVEVNGVALDRFLPEFDRLQAENSLANLRTNLGVEPDHYYLAATDDGQLEVIEACGSSPVPTKMFIRYGDETGLGSKWESDTFEAQRPGAARLQTGAVQGAFATSSKRRRMGSRLSCWLSFRLRHRGASLKITRCTLRSSFQTG